MLSPDVKPTLCFGAWGRWDWAVGTFHPGKRSAIDVGQTIKRLRIWLREVNHQDAKSCRPELVEKGGKENSWKIGCHAPRQNASSWRRRRGLEGGPDWRC